MTKFLPIGDSMPLVGSYSMIWMYIAKDISLSTISWRQWTANRSAKRLNQCSLPCRYLFPQIYHICPSFRPLSHAPQFLLCLTNRELLPPADHSRSNRMTPLSISLQPTQVWGPPVPPARFHQSSSSWALQKLLPLSSMLPLLSIALTVVTIT